MTDSGSASRSFVVYEYKDITIENRYAHYYLDGYACFGWHCDDNVSSAQSTDMVTLHFRRDRRMLNRTELTRLQRQFEADITVLHKLEASKSACAVGTSLLTGILGAAFTAGAVFAALSTPPVRWLCVVLGIAGAAGLVLPLFLYRWVWKKRAGVVDPLIEAKYQEIFMLFEKGDQLLHG